MAQQGNRKVTVIFPNGEKVEYETGEAMYFAAKEFRYNISRIAPFQYAFTDAVFTDDDQDFSD